ncbi:sensor domain-containing diguanylate cyclase [Azohydromonas sediminis]|uniref:GGDEF domain-containing protein n=1 Tax=Azohydromonas sediminis TaxID=2259674 RepID=UPI000E65A1CB|nr:GGDEF domain-containing protein [Azohydromonas sediminis]
MLVAADVHLPTLMLAAAGVALLCAAVTSAMLAGQPQVRGRGAWSAAQWLAAVGLAAFALTGGGAPASTLGAVLLLAWPGLVVFGVRRFHGRQPPPIHPGFDAGVLAIALLVALADGATHAPGTAWLGAMTVVHAHAAWVLFGAPARRHSAALRRLVALVGSAAAVHGTTWVASLVHDPAVPGAPVALSMLASALSVAAMAFATMGMTHERAVDELRESRRRLRYLANIDMLTQVPNRRHFGELARRVLQSAGGRSAAVLMFDIDHFKRINDELGHAAGDRALRLVARCVQETLRADDVAGRHGGDEFALLLPRTDLRDAMAVATRIVQRAQRLAREHGTPQLSLSFGVVQMRDDESLDEALRRADQALYEAKRQGRGRAVSADGDELHPVFVESRRLGLV